MERFTIFLEHAGPRRLHITSGESWFIYTYACYEPGEGAWQCGLGGVLVGPTGATLSFFSVCLSKSQRDLLGAKLKRTMIFEAELLALVLAFAVWRDRLDAVPLICFIDNNSARDLAISGAGRNLVAKALIGFLLKLEMAVCASPWYSRVPTPSNIADDPSRGEVQPFLSQGVEQLDPTEALGHILEVLSDAADKEG